MIEQYKYGICKICKHKMLENQEVTYDNEQGYVHTACLLVKEIWEIKKDINMGIKLETGKEREYNTGAKRQNAEGKGTPVLFPGDAYLGICKHFEDGAAHYGGRNWEKGLPLSTYIDSIERHIAQEKMGLTDESHDRAIAWNAVCYLATKLRIKAGILPKELDDLYGAYKKLPIKKSEQHSYKGHKIKE